MSLQNRIVRELGLPGQLFREAEKRTSGDDVQFTAKEGGIYYGLVTASGTAKITCIGGSRDEETLGDLKRGCILYLGYLEAGQTITLKNGDEKDETPKISVDIYQMNEELLAEALAKLESPHLEEVQWESDAVSGRIALEEPRRLILSIPYEDGWTVWMNGEKKSGELFGAALWPLTWSRGIRDRDEISPGRGRGGHRDHYGKHCHTGGNYGADKKTPSAGEQGKCS